MDRHPLHAQRKQHRHVANVCVCWTHHGGNHLLPRLCSRVPLVHGWGEKLVHEWSPVRCPSGVAVRRQGVNHTVNLLPVHGHDIRILADGRRTAPIAKSLDLGQVCWLSKEEHQGSAVQHRLAASSTTNSAVSDRQTQPARPSEENTYAKAQSHGDTCLILWHLEITNVALHFFIECLVTAMLSGGKPKSRLK